MGEGEKEKDDKGYGWGHPLESAADKQSNQLIFKLCKSTKKVVIEREAGAGGRWNEFEGRWFVA